MNLLNDYIDKHSGEKFKDMYLNKNALKLDSRWEEVRALAKKVIALMKWRYEAPKKTKATYVEG